jgi:hypothetical protein
MQRQIERQLEDHMKILYVEDNDDNIYMLKTGSCARDSLSLLDRWGAGPYNGDLRAA